MSQSPGAYRRLTGMLRMNGHSPVIEVDDRSILRLVTDEDLHGFDARSVVVEGTLSPDHRLHVTWIGLAAG